MVSGFFVLLRVVMFLVCMLVMLCCWSRVIVSVLLRVVCLSW